jgi:hypothetical protein
MNAKGNPDDPARIVQTSQTVELERRISKLEEAQKELANHLLARHTQTMTWILSAVGLIVVAISLAVTWMGISSRTESREASDRMETRVQKAIDTMNANFEKLAGDALKRPGMEILSEGKPLEGKEFSAPMMQLTLKGFALHNNGEKRTDSIKAWLYCSRGVSLVGARISAETYDPEYPSMSLLLGFNNLTLGKDETWPFEDDLYLQLSPAPSQTNFACKLVVYYGGDKPAEAKFRLRLGK